MASADPASAETATASDQMPKPARYPVALRVVHACAVVVVVASVLAGRFPFAWPFDSVQHRPMWGGLVLSWGLGTAAYIVLWHFAMRGVRTAEIFLIVMFVLGAAWAASILLISFLQLFGASEGSGVGGWAWSLRVIVALATLVGAAALLRWQQTEGARETRDKALGTKGVLAAVAVGVLGMVAMAWTLAVISPPQSGQAGAVAAVRKGMSTGIDTNSVNQFQASVTDRVDVLSHDETRNRWAMLEGVFKGKGYNNQIQWGEQVLYRDQVVCVARSVEEAKVVVLAGYCPG
jgi:uncharacterized membrane protein YidH (DUF202 family)